LVANVFGINYLIIIAIVIVRLLTCDIKIEDDDGFIEIVQKYIPIWKIIIPMFIYCLFGFAFMFLKYDGVFIPIPVVPEAVEFIERIPLIWPLIFGIALTSSIFAIIETSEC